MSTTRRTKPVRKPVSRTPAWVGPAAGAVLVALIVGAFFLIRWYTTPLPPAAPGSDVTQTVLIEITSLPQSEFDSIGQGSANNLIKPAGGTGLVGATGKPEVFYEGAEYCPYCAAERWAMIVALSRFGTFSGLQTTTSSSTDIYANTVTFTFRSATYTSQYIDFRAVETSDRNQQPLQTPTSAEQSLVSKYDSGGTIPFLDFGNRYASTGAMYSPDLLGGMRWPDVALAVQNSDSTQAKAIVGAANLITAAICKLTGDQPAAVCSTASMQGLEKKLG